MDTNTQPWCLVFNRSDHDNPRLTLQRGDENLEGFFRSPKAPDEQRDPILFEISFFSYPGDMGGQGKGQSRCYVYDYTETTDSLAKFPKCYTERALLMSGAIERLVELMQECAEGKYD